MPHDELLDKGDTGYHDYISLHIKVRTDVGMGCAGVCGQHHVTC